MSVVIGAASRAQLSHSLPIVLQRREYVLERLEAQLDAVDSGNCSRPSEIAALVLVETLIDAARSIVDTGALAANPDLTAELDALGIGGRHISRFGDALVPTLKDISLPGAVAALWCDIFWAALRLGSDLREAVGA